MKTPPPAAPQTGGIRKQQTGHFQTALTGAVRKAAAGPGSPTIFRCRGGIFFSCERNPPPVVEDAERFYRSGVMM